MHIKTLAIRFTTIPSLKDFTAKIHASMIDSKSSVKGKSDSSKDEPQQILELEAQELAKHRLRHLKDSFEEYNDVYTNYLHRHYLIVSLCGVVILFGIIIFFLKAKGKESLLHSFKALQSSFASLISGGSIIGFGSRIFFSNKKTSDDSKDEPKKEAIRLCIKGNLGEKLDKTTKKLLDKKGNLERAMSWQSIWAIFGSIVVLFLVGIDFFGFLPNIKYIDMGLDVVLSVTGVCFSYCACVLQSVLSEPIEELEKSRLKLFFTVIPCAWMDGLMYSDEITILTIMDYAIHPKKSRNEPWVKESYLSSDERVEIMVLLRGLNPDISHLGVDKFYKELMIPENPTEKSPLVVGFIDSVNEIESKARQEVLEKYFILGEALAECLKNQRKPKDRSVEVIVEKFSSIKFDEEICKHYINLDIFGRGLTLSEFFDRHSRKRPQNLLPEEIKCAHNALKVYSIFNEINGIGKGNIKRIKMVSVSSIGNFTKNEIIDIIEKFKIANYKKNNENNA